MKFTVRFRGREITHPEKAQEQLDWIVGECEEIANVEVRPAMEQRTMTLLMAPKPAVMQKVAQALTGAAGFQRLASPASGVGQTLQAASNGRSVMVQLAGSDPGMVGHQSRFSVVTATVFVAQ